MYIKLTRSRGNTYAQLTESFRDASTGKPRQRTLATLGRIDEAGGQLDAVLAALLRAKGRGAEAAVIAASAPAMPAVPGAVGTIDAATTPELAVTFDCALALGDVWVLDQLWHELGFDRLSGVFRRARFTSPVEHAIRAMVFNRLCDADSKLGVLRWLQTVSMPNMDAPSLSHQQLLRSMDALMDHQEGVDSCVASLLRPLIDTELSVVFYDLTTIRAAGASQMQGDVRKLGLSKEGGFARQFLLGVVQTAEGLPIYHEVFEGNASEGQTLEPTLTKVLARYPQIGRLIVVADRGLLSLENLQQLSQWVLPSGKPLEYILAVPGRRYGDFAELLQPLQSEIEQHNAPQETIQELSWQGQRLVVAHDPERAQEQSAKRQQKIKELEALAEKMTAKLDSQDAGKRAKGRKASDGGAKARFYRAVCEAHLASIIQVDFKSALFTYEINRSALAKAQLMDGKLLLVTNVAEQDLNPQEVLLRYKSLADIERGFRVLKSDIEIAPVYHRLPQRIRAHASICFMALILHRVMRMRLKAANHPSSPQTALELLRRVQRHSIRINGAQSVQGVSSINAEQRSLMAALGVKRLPKEGGQMMLK